MIWTGGILLRRMVVFLWNESGSSKRSYHILKFELQADGRIKTLTNFKSFFLEDAIRYAIYIYVGDWPK